MKVLQVQLLLIFSIGFFCATIGYAQKSTYELHPGYYTFGLNAGWSYQSSDVKIDKGGFGFGATFGKNLYYAPSAPLSFDLRARLLYTQQRGLNGEKTFDLSDNIRLNGTETLNYLSYPTNLNVPEGFVYANHRTDIGELGLEAVLTLNRLRERTGLIISFYGGLGLDWHIAHYDQAKPDGLEYFTEYANLSEGQRQSAVRQELRNAILDGDYETLAAGFDEGGRIGLMPSLGLELGLQVTPKFSIFAGHRITFSGHDDLDGLATEAGNDRYHYTNLGMRWIIDKGYTSATASPIIRILSPLELPFNTTDQNGRVRAEIMNVNSPADISCSVNGRLESFRYENGSFLKTLQLRPGSNEIVIRAENSSGSSQERVVIFYEGTISPPAPSTPSIRRPDVLITSPRNATETTEQSQYNIQASISEVKDKNDIEFFINGARNNFQFDTRSGQLSSNVNLKEGSNRIRIRATNTAGSDESEVTITRQTQVQLPSVSITTPRQDNSRTSSRQANIIAEIRNVNQRNSIRFTVNGRGNNQFEFSRGRFQATVNLQVGRNTIQVSAVNADGRDDDQVTIIREEQEVITGQPPVVRITQPANRSVVPSPTIRLSARVQHISQKRAISLQLNGREVYDFTFNSSRSEVSARLNLQEGSNSIRLMATNPQGRQSDQISVSYVAPVQAPTVKIQRPANNSNTTEVRVPFIARTTGIERRDQIQLQINGRRDNNFGFNLSRQEISGDFNLRSGNNELLIVVENNGGRNQDRISVNYQNTPPPKVTFTQPANGSATSDQSNYPILANITQVPDRGNIRVTLNGNRVSNFTYNGSTLRFSANLIRGNNKVRIQLNTVGGSDEASASILYEPIEKPIVSITSPSNNSAIENDWVTLRASTKNITDIAQLTLSLNGKNIPRFSFRGGDIATRISGLIAGTNTIRLSAKNAGGSAEDAVTVTYSAPAPVLKPIVQFIDPNKSGGTTMQAKMTVSASVEHVNSKNQIAFSINGRAIRDFAYDSRTRTVQANVNLNTGRNNFKITATNAGGETSATTNINYLATNEPTVVIQSASEPTINPLNPSIARSVIIAKTTNIKEKSQIRLTINGNVFNSFDFNASTGQLQATINLQKGDNVIKIQAANAVGSAESERTVVY